MLVSKELLSKVLDLEVTKVNEFEIEDKHFKLIRINKEPDDNIELTISILGLAYRIENIIRDLGHKLTIDYNDRTGVSEYRVILDDNVPLKYNNRVEGIFEAGERVLC